MADDRTAEQRAADDGLREAITRCARAYGQMDPLDEQVLAPSDVLTGFVVVGHADSFELQDEHATRYVYLTQDTGAPIHETLGLLHLGRRYYGSYGVTSDDAE